MYLFIYLFTFESFKVASLGRLSMVRFFTAAVHRIRQNASSDSSTSPVELFCAIFNWRYPRVTSCDVIQGAFPKHSGKRTVTCKMSTSHEEHLLLELMEEDLVLEKITYTLLMTRRQLLRTSKRKHRYWIHDILKRRVEQGAARGKTPLCDVIGEFPRGQPQSGAVKIQHCWIFNRMAWRPDRQIGPWETTK